MLNINLVFVTAVPVLIAALSMYASKPDSTQYGGSKEVDYKLERYKWLADIGLDFQFAGLTSLIAAVLLSESTIGIDGVVFILLYVLGMSFGLVRYRDHKYRSVTDIGKFYKNEPLVIGLCLLVVTEFLIVLNSVLA
ncbi:MAG: hypothetical protein JRN20_19075 [Nitrososphaerota archaeon]|nr:hypothetical protein [Nitrososphaerota archaeon]